MINSTRLDIVSSSVSARRKACRSCYRVSSGSQARSFFLFGGFANVCRGWLGLELVGAEDFVGDQQH